MKNCMKCDKSLLVTDETGYTEIKCIAKSKKGKVIYWACTTLNSPCESDIAEYGNVRVQKYMENKKPPKWCPLSLL